MAGKQNVFHRILVTNGFSFNCKMTSINKQSLQQRTWVNYHCHTCTCKSKQLWMQLKYIIVNLIYVSLYRK